MVYDPKYEAFLVYFNRDHDYFECHEVMEELWLSQERDLFYKGLLQIAVGAFHFRAKNYKGAIKMLESAAEMLRPYPVEHAGIQLGKIRDEAVQLAQELKQMSEEPVPYRDLFIEVTDPKLGDAVSRLSAQISPNDPIRLRPQRGPNHDLRDLRWRNKHTNE
ncbi:DUF309 domain-containing protein [Paenibacillus sp. CAA11]|uniref:DUF309 domain-containing protein n=1 Tax=Paenibacillus sp. CAA11 TaxID=1532905 RepID=UPI000D3A0EB9|nr:DUF309 domain-containing protein [Paenibacillus sp. CAA11]AWB44174.1 DUF309 domain-containing protein [Paenibacillus sp. CAA11]